MTFRYHLIKPGGIIITDTCLIPHFYGGVMTDVDFPMSGCYNFAACRFQFQFCAANVSDHTCIETMTSFIKHEYKKYFIWSSWISIVTSRILTLRLGFIQLEP